MQFGEYRVAQKSVRAFIHFDKVNWLVGHSVETNVLETPNTDFIFKGKTYIPIQSIIYTLFHVLLQPFFPFLECHSCVFALPPPPNPYSPFSSSFSFLIFYRKPSPPFLFSHSIFFVIHLLLGCTVALFFYPKSLSSLYSFFTIRFLFLLVHTVNSFIYFLFFFL
jgi:hypothetical protein